MKTSSAKAKGRKLQQEVVKCILKNYPDLTPLDVRSTSMGVTGQDVQLSSMAAARFPMQVECKNRAAIAIYKDYEQACTHGTLEPLLVIKQNHSKPLAVVDLEFFIKLMSERKQ